MTFTKVVSLIVVVLGLIHLIHADNDAIVLKNRRDLLNHSQTANSPRDYTQIQFSIGASNNEVCNCRTTPSAHPLGTYYSLDVAWPKVDFLLSGSNFHIGGVYLSGSWSLLATLTDLTYAKTSVFYSASELAITELNISPHCSAAAFTVLSSSEDISTEIANLNADFVEWLSDPDNSEQFGLEIADFVLNHFSSVNVPASLYVNLGLCTLTTECFQVDF